LQLGFAVGFNTEQFLCICLFLCAYLISIYKLKGWRKGGHIFLFKTKPEAE